MTDQPFIGGTGAAALAGVNPPRWGQPLDLYLELRGEAPPRAQSRMMAMGQLMEQVVADLFTEATGIALRRPAQRAGRTCRLCTSQGHPCTAIRSRRYPWAGAHIDRWTGDGLIFEAKWGERRDEWGDGLPIGTPEAPTIIPAPGDESYQPVVPARYAVQVQHYMAVTGAPTAYLAVLLGYGDFRWYAIHRDDRLIGTLMDLEQDFWVEHCLAGVPPAPDGTESYGAHLARRWQSQAGETIATPEQQALVAELRTARRAREAAQAAEALVAQRVQETMGPAELLVGPGFRIRWASRKPQRKVAWEELSTDLLGQARLPIETARAIGAVEGKPWDEYTKKARAEMVRAYAEATGHSTLAAEGTRPFSPEWDEDEEAL